MKIGDIIAKIGELISAVENAENNNTSTQDPGTPDPKLRNPAGMAPVIIQSADDKPSPNGQTASGNDKEPEELFLPPLQQKQELLKKAVGVENIYDDGRPGDASDENAEAPTPEEEDLLQRIKRMAGVPVAAVQELSNDDVFDD
jgi:hypothetical protein